MIPSHIFRTSITLLVVSFLIWAWPTKGPDQVLDVRANADGAVASQTTPREVRIVDNGLETKLSQSTIRDLSASLSARPLAANELAGILSNDGTVGGLLEQLGYKVAAEDIVFPARGELAPSHGQIIIKRAPGVILHYDGKTKQVKTLSGSVQELLKEKKIKLGKDDRVEPDFTTKIVPNLDVRVIRVKFKEEQETEAVPFEIKSQDDPSNYLGQQSIKAVGQNGERVKSYKITLEDGKEVKRDLVKEEVTKRPVTKIVLVGSKPWPISTGSGGGDYWGLINAATAKYGVDAGLLHRVMICESGGNPEAVNGWGNKGLFQFDQGTFNTYNVDFPGASIWDPQAQIYAAAYAFSHGGRGRWGCQG